MKCKLLVSYACSLKIYSLVNWSHGNVIDACSFVVPW